MAGGNIYFDTSKLEDYYKLTNHKEDEMVVGVREGVEFDNFKKNQADFVLWFTKSKFDDQELKWDSPWGTGYPGWHIECSGICMHYCGEKLDIHGGGVDNIFPHHTNEIAQSEAFLGHKWCNYWFHNEHLMDETGKMSKSKGATLTISVLKEKGYDPLAYRFMCLTSHYRRQLVFSFDILDNAETSYKKLKNKVLSLNPNGVVMKEEAEVFENQFKSHLENDLNTSNALTLIYDLLKSNLNDATKYSLIEKWDQVLSLDLTKKEKKQIDFDETYIQEMIEKRNQAKKRKDFITSDKIRDELKEQGILLKDTREGTTFEIK